MKRVDEEYTKREVKVNRLGVEDAKRRIHWMKAVGVGSITESVPLQDEAAIWKEPQKGQPEPPFCSYQ